MAAYAALVSLFNTLDQIKNHPRFSNSFDKYQIQFLGQKIDFFLNFVENYSCGGGIIINKEAAEELERQITCAAHEAEDIVESYIVNQILSLPKRRICNFNLFSEDALISEDARLHEKCLFGLQRVLEDMDSIKDKVLKVQEERDKTYQKPTNSTPTASSASPVTTGKSSNMVGFDEELYQLKDVLTGHQSSLQIISIVGMGGAGKTTLAKYVYEDSVIMHHFDIRAWATISQDYNDTDVFLQLLSLSDGTKDELGERLHKKLFGRRYLIILDDMWSIEVWDSIKNYLPDSGDGSRVIVTTRMSNMATQLGSICTRINLLDEHKSWILFCQQIFGGEDCPLELVEIGKRIVRMCKGLPLFIIVMGGLLRKSHGTVESWKNTANNINSILKSSENDWCLDVLCLSYSHLPAHLKPCFLYMGIFREDSEIRVSEIIKLWVAEGFLKPNGLQMLEDIAEDYVIDLIGRNLILVRKYRSNGKIKSFQMHDLVRELCLRVANKEKFFSVLERGSKPPGICGERRLVIGCDYFMSEDIQSAPVVRSVIGDYITADADCRLLRVLTKQIGSFEAEMKNVNLRYLDSHDDRLCFSPSISLYWNLQTLDITYSYAKIDAPFEIWKMKWLRHLKFFRVYLPDPPPSGKDDESVVLGNLQTLKTVVNPRLSEEMCKRIPNVKKLGFEIYKYEEGYENLGRLQKIESLTITFPFLYGIYYENDVLKKAFPKLTCLKKLELTCSINNNVDKLLVGIGWLPQLQVLKLNIFDREEQGWSCVEGQFPGLKFLQIKWWNLRCWSLESNKCFPVLEKLLLHNLEILEEIPSEFGEIPTLQLIRLKECRKLCLVISAMKIKEEQNTTYGNDDLAIQADLWGYTPEMKRRLMEMVEEEGLSITNIHLER